MHATKLSFILLITAISVSAALSAQQATTTSVAISVKDPSGAAIPHAQIRVVPAPDPFPKMETNERGLLALDLKPGHYGLLVQSLGFKKSVTRFDVRETKDLQTVAVVLQVGVYSGPEVRPTPSADALVVVVEPFPEPVKLSTSDLKSWPHLAVTATIHT